MFQKDYILINCRLLGKVMKEAKDESFYYPAIKEWLSKMVGRH
jgi:hypothetical protein